MPPVPISEIHNYRISKPLKKTWWHDLLNKNKKTPHVTFVPPVPISEIHNYKISKTLKEPGGTICNYKKTKPNSLNYIDLNSTKTKIHQILQQKGWLLSEDEEILEIEKPGEGNMNVVLRIKTNNRSFILKQSRPYVQKYQQIEAPLDRIEVENQFYKSIKSKELETYVPGIIAYDPAEYLMMMEDLGHCEDMAAIYQNRTIDTQDLSKLIQILSFIHQSKLPENYPPNLALRQLNHQHIFVLPFLEDNGFELDEVQPGLQNLSLFYKKNKSLKNVINTIGQQYLSKGTTLLHGDYYPGSWMNKEANIYIIDPEFSFAGFAEFDLGVMAAHIIMATGDDMYVESIYQQYLGKAKQQLVYQMTGIEIMRRLIGLAQLPLQRSIEEKEALLKMAEKMIMS